MDRSCTASKLTAYAHGLFMNASASTVQYTILPEALSKESLVSHACNVKRESALLGVQCV